VKLEYELYDLLSTKNATATSINTNIAQSTE
jgi:hypothetical protein